jgi:hypothetical protein
MKALVTHMSEKGRAAPKKLEDDLDEVKLLYEMFQKGETLPPEQVATPAILDASEQERNEQLINKINYFAIAALEKLHH